MMGGYLILLHWCREIILHTNIETMNANNNPMALYITRPPEPKKMEELHKMEYR